MAVIVGSGFHHSIHYDKHYQIGAVAGDTSSFVSLCAKSEFMLNPESSSNNLYNLDPEIDRTLYRLRKIKNTDVGSSDSFNSISNSVNNSFATNSEFLDCSNSSFYVKLEPTCGENKSEESKHMENQDRILKELATSNVLESAQSYELKFGLIDLLPKFHGLAGEDPHKHLKGFHVQRICIPTTGSFSHLGRYETHVSGEFLLGIQNCDHPKGDIWDQATLKRNPERILGDI
ncbi:hypothetical protein CR513_17440, partial [Mucuna pruriens]